MIYYVAGVPFSDELYHSGRKGMKWGEHRFHSIDDRRPPKGHKPPPGRPPKKSRHSSGKASAEEMLNSRSSSSSKSTLKSINAGKEAVDSIISGKKRKHRRPPRKPPRRPPRRPPRGERKHRSTTLIT